MSLALALLLLPGLTIGLTLHEFAHAWSASLLGDDFPRRQGRVSLNPLHHLSLLGTLALLLLPFGWGKPVQVNLYNFKHPRRDYLLTSLAGPAANVIVLIVCIGLMQITRHDLAYGPAAEPWLRLAHTVLMLTGLINAILAVVNLIPIPPLDGSKIWTVLVPHWKPAMTRKSSRVFLILLVVLAMSHSLSPMIGGVVSRIEALMPPADSTAYDSEKEEGHKAFLAQRYDQAQAHYTRALEICDTLSDGWGCRALVRLAREDVAGALADVERAIAIDPAQDWNYDMRANIREAQGLTQQAQADRERARQLRGDGPAATRPATTRPATQNGQTASPPASRRP